MGTDFVKDSDGNFVPEHYVVVTGIVNDRFVVADVGYRGVSTLDDPTPHGVVPKVHNYHNNFETRGRLVDPVDLSSLTVAADEGVDFIVTDALGHRVGYDGVTKLVFKEIPGSAFFIDAMRDIPSEQPASATTRSAILAQIAAGNFTIAVRGRVTGPFAIQISGIDSNGSDHPNIEISDTIISGGLKTYGIAYSSNPGIGTKLVSTIVPHVVGQTQISAASAINGSGLTVGAITTQSSGTIPAGLVISQNPAAAAAVSAASPVNLVISSGSGLVTIPNVVGLSQATAVKAITDAGLTLGTVTTQPSTTIAAGNIITENPAAGTLVSAGSKVSLIVSTGPVLVVVPNVVGSSQSAATTAITGVGLKLGTVTTQASTTVAAGNVISESPAASTSVAAGSSVNLVVSSGPAPVAVPNVVGLSQAAASTAITTAGLNLGTVTTQASSTVPAGIVISESPAVGTLVVKGSSVNLVLSSGPLAGDVNGDGVISCTDATLIKTTFGKRTGQVGFDVRADINKDGVIDVRDLAFVTQRLPAGTKCP